MRLLLRVSFLILSFSSLCFSVRFTYPPNTELVVDVTQPPWNVDNSGATDVTTNLQAIIDTYKHDTQQVHPYIIYLPDGIYPVSKTLMGSTLDDSNGQGWIIIQGESRTGTVIKLKDNCDGTGDTEDFTDTNNKRAVLNYFFGNGSNNVFVNGLENITIDVGSGNAGAIGVHFYDNNCGSVRRVTIRPSGSNPVGKVGLSTTLRGPDGYGLISDVAIQGFDVGLDFNSYISYMGWAVENISLCGQTECGIDIKRRPISIRRLTSTNSVPAIRVQHGASLVSVIDSTCVGGSSANAAIHVDAGGLFARNITIEGYTTTVYDAAAGGYVTNDISNDEYVTGGGARLWDSTPLKSLNLPICETPDVPWDDTNDWAFVDIDTQTYDTESIRAAMESGKSTVIFPPGVCTINETIVIGRNVRRIVGQWTRLEAAGTLLTTPELDPLFRLEDSAHDTVVFEKFDSLWNGENLSIYLMHHSGDADLVMRDIFFVEGPAYRNDPVTSGRLFVENVHSIPGGHTPRYDQPAWTIVNQDMWARQINPETLTPHFWNEGGRIWILGFKCGECQGPVVKTMKHGETELLTGVMNMTHNPGPDSQATLGLLDCNNGKVSATLFERCTWSATTGGNGWGFHSNMVIETRGTEERRAIHRAQGYKPWSNHWFSIPGITNRLYEHGAFITLFAGYPDPDAANTPPSPPEIVLPSVVTFPSGITCRASAYDPDNGPLTTVVRWYKDAGHGRTVFTQPTETNTTVTFSTPGVYSLRASVSDGLASTSSIAHTYSVFQADWNAPLRRERRINDSNDDGIGSSVSDSGFRIGEPSEGYAYRMQYDFDIRAMRPMTNSIASATLWVTPKSISGSAPDIDVYLTESYGSIQPWDYQQPGIFVTSLYASSYIIDEPLAIPCTDQIIDVLASGKASIGLKLQRHVNQAGAPNYIALYGVSNATTEDQKPHLTFSPKAPSAPLQLTTTVITTASISLAWDDANDNESAYILERRNNTTGQWTVISSLSPINLHYTDDAVSDPDIMYYYRVAASNDVGLSPYSNIVNAYLLPEPGLFLAFFIMIACAIIRR